MNCFLKNIYFVTISFLCMNLNSVEITFTDKDVGIPLEGVIVRKSDTSDTFYSDSDGKITIEEFSGRAVFTAYLIGYEIKKFAINQTDKFLILEMSIEDVLEGKELVIESKSAGKKDEKIGVSTVINKDEIKSSAMIGPVEDVVTAIKTLPGVSYTGKFSSRPSVRGGRPSEVTASLDGFLVRFPYHWGGAFSIFNPNIIDSVKFSNGIFGVKYGVAMSGLLEVNTVTPNEGLKIDGIFSTTTTELFIQTALWKNSGLFIGGRVTYLDLTMALLESFATDLGAKISPAPYIRDASFKWFWKPDDRAEWYINFFFGSDGVGMKYKDPGVDETKEINTTFDFSNFNYDLFCVTGVKILPHDKVFIHILTGYEFLYYGSSINMTENGRKKYSANFTNWYNSLPIEDLSDDEFEVRALKSHRLQYNVAHSVQTRADFDFTLHNKVIMSLGGGLVFDVLAHRESGTFYSFVLKPPSSLVYMPVDIDINVENNMVWNSFIYLSFTFNILPNILEIDLGVRLDHFYMRGIDVSLNTYPVPNPRFTINYTPVRNMKYLESLTLSAGAGLFSKIPIESSIIEKKYGLKDFDIGQPKNISAVTGVELNFPLGFKLKIEGYYKYYFDLFYINNDSSGGKMNFLVHTDGIGHSAGFDVLFQRKLSKYIDGWLSYTFIFAKYFNPSTDDIPSGTTMSGDPTNMWYYPSYHRWHTLNIVLSVKPLNWLTLSTKFAFASGSPKKEFYEKTMLSADVYYEDGGKEILELYNRSSGYKEDGWDTIRSGFSVPLDFEVRFHFYFPRTRVNFEAYIAVEDTLSYFYSDGLETSQIDKYTGEEMQGVVASFNVGFPIPSIGIKINF